MSIIGTKLHPVPKFLKNICKYSKSNDFVKVTEVGPRDGLQNESKVVPTDVKIKFINMLTDCGFPAIETTSFVSPKWVPQMADNSEVMKSIRKSHNVSYSVLVPNMKGYEAALAAGATEIAIFGAASETFSKKNLNCTIAESIERFREVTLPAKRKGLKVRGYVSCVVGCPYEGPIKPAQVAKTVLSMLNLGCNEVSLGDTIGVGTAGSFKRMLKEVFHVCPPQYLALHCHDTYGQALANIVVGLEEGIRSVDSSVSGLGGCPYAKGASGNVATEDLVYMLHGSGVTTGIDLPSVIKAGRFISEYLERPNNSRASRAIGNNEKTNTELKMMASCLE